jgi:hypothetical protein
VRVKAAAQPNLSSSGKCSNILTGWKVDLKALVKLGLFGCWICGGVIFIASNK